MKSRTVPNILSIFSVFALVLFITGCRQTDDILPKTLYYTNGSGNSAQLWRMEMDGVSRSQLTDEPSGVDGFSVSPVDGTLALVSENKLFLITPESQNRQLIIDGGVVDSVDHPSYTSQVKNPIFSPDGETLAYSLNGIHLYDITTGVDNHILPNPTIVNGTAQDYAKGAYSVGPWSPDGTKLLVVISYYEGCMLTIMEPGANGNLHPLETEGAVGCQTTWSEDGRYILAANPYFNGAQSGLWQFDAITGQETLTLARDDTDHTSNFIGWPYQSSDGELYLFHANLEDIPPPEGIHLTLVLMNKDYPELVPISPEAFLIRTALWKPDGDGVLLVGDRDGTGRQLLLIDLESGTSRVLIDEADQVRVLVWGP